MFNLPCIIFSRIFSGLPVSFNCFEIISKQLKETGKPDNILEKMMQGKLNKFYEENTLMGQKFVIDPSISIEQYLAQASKEINTQINIQEFLRFEIGS